MNQITRELKHYANYERILMKHCIKKLGQDLLNSFNCLNLLFYETD